MRWLALVVLVGCYRPTIPAGTPCSESGDCPANQACIANVCGGGTDAPMPADADEGDAFAPLDGPIDARLTVAPTFRSQHSDKGNGGTRTVAFPPGTQPGDLLLAHVSVDNHTANEVPTPTGWTRVTELDNGTDCTAIVFYAFATQSGPPSSWTFPGISTTNDNAIVISAFTGVDPTAPINAVSTLAMLNTTTPSTAALVTTVANTRLVALFAMDRTNGPLAQPQGMTEIYEDIVTGTGLLFEGAHAAFSGPGDTGPLTASVTDDGISIGILVALAPQ